VHDTATATRLDFVALELTRRCPLTCPSLCYAQAGPTLGHGTMTTAQWKTIVDDAVALGARDLQLIGGEPTAAPSFAAVLAHALGVGLRVEVYTNLVAIKRSWWDELFTRPNVSLATSYHSDAAAQHDQITGRPGSHARTRANIVEALARSVPLRVGIIHTIEGQRVAEAEAELRSLGVERVGTDRVRAIGNAAHSVVGDASQLCGRCGHGRAAVSSDGEVWPCVLGRWLVAGNVRDHSLTEVLAGPHWRRVRTQIPAPHAKCVPECKPGKGDGSDCAPAETEACDPAYCKPDTKQAQP
jgi:MoaA/NifB/PqqE/SkfB family radical SAM enzyme